MGVMVGKILGLSWAFLCPQRGGPWLPLPGLILVSGLVSTGSVACVS